MVKGQKVYIKQHNVRGKVVSVSKNGGTVSVQTDDGIIIVAKRLIVLWDTLSWLSRLIIKIFSKK